MQPIPSQEPYKVSNAAVSTESTFTFDLTNSAPNNQIAANLTVEMTFYKSGLAQVVLENPGEEPRFAISSTGLPVEWDNLEQVTELQGHVVYTDTQATVTLYSEDLTNTWQYVIQYDPFRIILTVNDEVTTVVNHDDSLRYAALDAPHNTYYNGYD